MAHPARNASADQIVSGARTFFATTKTSLARRLLQSERNALLLIDVVRSNVAAGRFQLHDFVIMPDHLHLLLTVPGDVSIEKAMQLIKGRFSFRLKREFGAVGEIWQRGFSEVRIMEGQSFFQHRADIAENPVKAGLVERAEEWPYCYGYLARQKSAGANAQSSSGLMRPD